MFVGVRQKKELVAFIRYLSRFGVLRGVFIYFILKLTKIERITIPGLRHPICLRPDTSDLEVFEQIFLKRHYDFAMPGHKIEHIIDCGANIGLSSIFFAVKFPEARIIAIEPEDSNFAVLERNSGGFENIVALKCAVWEKSAMLQIHDPGLGNYGFTTIEDRSLGNASVKALGIKDIMLQFGFDHIDLLKIDIEGAEKELFSSNYEDWLPKTKLLAIEVHDRLRPGTSTALIKALAKFDFSIFAYGESLVCVNNSPGIL